MPTLPRRQFLATVVAAATATGLGVAAGGTAAHGSPPHGAPHGPHHDAERPRGPKLPPVPGMHGDRTANELWYEYERIFYYEASQEILDAYQAIGEPIGGRVENLFQLYRLSRQSGTYPDSFFSRVEPARDAYALLSRLQLETLDRFYRNDRQLTMAFLYMGEGSLYDPRMPEGFKVHMMNVGPNGEPATGWHIWHATNRAMTMLGIDVDRWSTIDWMVGIGWEAHAIAQPATDAINPPLPRRVAQRVIRNWWRRSPEEMDDAFDSFPDPPWLT